MIILGLNHGEVNSSAAIYKDGKIVAGSPQERFNRQKNTKDFPAMASKYCLDAAGVDIGEVDFVAQAWNPGAGWEKYNPMMSNTRVKREDYFYTIPDHLFNLTERKPQEWVLMDFPEGSNIPPVYYIQHHRAHAANAFFLSSFEEAAILTADWRGEFECTTMGMGRGNDIEILQTQKIPHSIGMFYATYTELLGYRPDSDEWKVMALSAYDLECQELVEKVRSTVTLAENGNILLDESYYKGALLDQPKLYTPKLVELLGGREGVKHAEVDDWYIKVAKAMQIVSEEMATHMLEHLHKITQCKNVVLGGGYFMNSVFNGKVIDKTPFENVYISYAPGDVGNCAGAALYVAHCIKNQPRDFTFNASYIGPEYSDEDIEAALKRRRIKYQKLDNPADTVAKLISEGEIVSHFDGRMEFGDRALGNRSILADPRSSEIKDKINALIKYREGYRPFAPATLFEKASEYFEVESGYECHYMEKVVPVRQDYRAQLPAITHIDGSGRLQTVRKEDNDKYYDIIRLVGEYTGLPVVLNTSFNVNGEPVVLTPDDAISTFFNSGLTNLVLGSYLVVK